MYKKISVLISNENLKQPFYLAYYVFKPYIYL